MHREEVGAWVCPTLPTHTFAWGGRPVQRLDLQFYAFFMVVLSGMALGLLFDLLRALRAYFRPNPWVGAVGDLLYWGAATVALGAGLFYGNWGEFRIYVLVGLLIGLGLYLWLASPMILAMARALLLAIAWVLDLLWMLVQRLVWAPLLALAGLLLGIGRILWRWTRWLLRGLWGALLVVVGILGRPLVGPYRYLKLRYLLTKRWVKRRLRRWLLGGPRHRR